MFADSLTVSQSPDAMQDISPHIQELKELIPRIAQCGLSTVLIIGEISTGKELLATKS
jgi:DNA-binding NtrC family response regulator